MANLGLPGGGPPDPELIKERLLRYIKPPTPPWLIQKFAEEAETRREELGLGAPWEKRKPRREKEITGHKMMWPYRIAWAESLSGRGQVRVLHNEKVIGAASYVDRNDKNRLLNILEAIIKSKQ